MALVVQCFSEVRGCMGFIDPRSGYVTSDAFSRWNRLCGRIDHFNRDMRQILKVAEPRAIVPTVARLACNNRQHSSQMAGTETP